MAIQIDKNDPVSLEVVNKKLESFVEVVLGKLTEQQVEIRELKTRVKNLDEYVKTQGPSTFP